MAANAHLQSEIDAHLPKGASVREVERWMNSKGWGNSGLIDNAKLAHMGNDPNTYELKSLLRGSEQIALVHTDTEVTFIFDRSQKLIKSRVEPVHTGL